MARKDLMKGLMGDETPPSAPSTPSTKPRYSKGAIGAVSQSIAELKSRALIELVADQIDPGGLKDRLGGDLQADEALKASLREYGQQVPVLVRHDPNQEGRYQIVYGRRRVAALKALGMPVKALVRELTDRDLILAQGQENTARRDLSFIEKANFARQMREAGYDRKIICDALSIDKTVISRMSTIADAISPRLIAEIGAAPSIGRDRWLALAARIDGVPEAKSLEVVSAIRDQGSDARFEALFKALEPPKTAQKSKPAKLAGADGAQIGTATRGKAGLTLSFSKADGFDDWLADNIAEIHRRWSAGE